MSGGESKESKGGVSSADLDVRGLRLLLDFEKRLDDKLIQFRVQSKEDVSQMMALTVLPLKNQLDTITDRLERGDTSFKESKERQDDHSERIAIAVATANEAKQAASQAAAVCQNVRSSCQTRSSNALIKKGEEDDEDKKPSAGWISAAQLPSIITAIGALLTTVLSAVILTRTPAEPTKDNHQQPPQQTMQQGQSTTNSNNGP